MEHQVNWFEIAVTDFDRALTFYEGILDIAIQETAMAGARMGFFPADGRNISGAIVLGADYIPSMDGVTLYLNGGNDLQVVLDKVVAFQGKVIVPKTLINPETGYFGMFIDTEGNKMAVHSPN